MKGENQTHGGDWHSLGDALYRKWGIYDMQWLFKSCGDDFVLENFRMCGSSLGGPLALISLTSLRQYNVDSKGVKNDAAAATTNAASSSASSAGGGGGCTLSVFTSSGKLISDIAWDATKTLGDIIALGWSDHEQLVCVLASGRVLVYDIHCKLVRDFTIWGQQEDPVVVTASAALAAATIGRPASSNANGQVPVPRHPRGGVLEVHFWPDGFVAMIGDLQCIAVEGISSPNPASIPRIYELTTGLHPDSNPYTSMTIVPPLLSRSGLLEVLLGTTDNSILVVDENEVEDQLLQDRIAAPITKMAVTPNGQYVACYRRDGVMSVLSSAFANMLDFNTKSMSRPMEMIWCGDDAVVLQWKNTGIIMVGPYGDWLNFPYRGVVHLVAEPDCCRVITPTSCDMLQRVPASTEVIRRIGSTDPAALMFDAMEAFEEGDPKSDENIRSIAASNQLVNAISACINAASTEFDISRQQSLLKAAAYGKTFCAEVDPSEFVDIAKKCRVLNEVRRPDVGIPLTVQQYNRLTPEVLIGRLTMRNCHFLALKVCDLLQVSNKRVLIHWAAEKVKRLAVTDMKDEDIARIIRSKLVPKDGGRISFLEVAASAVHMGRRRLATIILDMEKNPADQVPLLLHMGEEELALRKAINSQETDLIYLVLMHLEKTCTDIPTYHKLVHSHAEAANLLKMYYRTKVTSTDRSILHNFLMYSRNYLEAGTAAVNQAYLQPTLVAKAQLIKEASMLFESGRDLSFYKTATDEQLELMDIQKSLEIRASRDFIGLSLSETLTNMTLLSLEFVNDAAMWERETQKLAKKFKVSDKHLWYIRIHCYSSTGHWGHLSKLAAEKKSPVGYKPFAKACMKYGQPNSETEIYIEKITEQEDKFDMLCEVESWRAAVEVARQLRDGDRLKAVLHRCKDDHLKRQILHLIEKL
jgi:hypothetical protein